MKAYLVMVLGLLIGVIYALFHVRSPAPPVVALVGLLGILLGEQIPSLIEDAWSPDGAVALWRAAVSTHQSPAKADRDDKRNPK